MNTRSPHRSFADRFFSFRGTDRRNRNTTRRRSLKLEPLEHRVLLAAGDYTINLVDLDTSTDFSETQKTILQSAAVTMQGLITADLPDVGGIDDLEIRCLTSAVPGEVGGALATAKDVTLRTSAPYLPYQGTIEFDSADIDALESSGQLEAVAMHEMAHVMGFGTAWDYLDQTVEMNLLDHGGTQFIGAAALSEYQTIIDPLATSIPLEIGGQEETALVHWSESVLGKELMTAWTSGTDNPISRITLASFQDMGYVVDMAQAEAFNFGTIRGTVWNDENDNGLVDTTESGLSGWTVFLDHNADDLLDANEPSVSTDASGEYFFSGLAANDYTVREIVQSNWAQTAPIGNEYLATVAEGQTVLDQDFGNATGKLSIDDIEQVEGDSGTSQFVFTVTLSKLVDSPVTVDYSTEITLGSATAGDQYESTSGTLTFDIADPLTKTIRVPVYGDTIEDSHHTFYIDLTNPSNAILEDSQGEGRILNDDGSLRMSIEGTSVLEGAERVDFTVNLSRADLAPVSVDFNTVDGTADFVPLSETITFAPGEVQQTVSVELSPDAAGDFDDSLVESDTVVTVNLSNPSTGVILYDGAAQATIQDDDVPNLAIGNAEATEGEDLVFQIEIIPEGTDVNQARGAYSSIQYETMDDTARAADGDYQATSNTRTFDPLQVNPLTILVSTLPDDLDEPDENLLVNLLYPAHANVSITPGTGTILDNDFPPAISINDAPFVVEGDELVWTVSLDHASANTVSVNYTTADDTAIAGEDYTSTFGVLTFLPSEQTKEIRVATLTDDIASEGDERVLVLLSDPFQATLVSSQGEGIIQDDWPSLSVTNTSSSEDNRITVTVSLSAPSSKLVTVDYATSDDTAIAGDDYISALGTLTFVPGQTEQSFDIALIHDAIDEVDETFTITLSNPSNASLDQSEAEATILDDDLIPSVSINDADPVVEGNDVLFTVTLSEASTKTITVDYQTVSGTASEEDYVAISETLTFEPGETEKTITLFTIDDDLDENEETFEIELTDGQNVSADVPYGTATLTDNEPKPTVTIADVEIEETDQGNIAAQFTVTLSSASGRLVTVDYATADDTALVEDDYLESTGTLTFQPGETEKTIEVLVPGNLDVDGDRAFLVNLSNQQAVVIEDDQGVGTIVDNDRQYLAEDTPLTIRDDNTIRSTILIEQSMILADLEVMVDLTHEHLSDLSARLISPDGTVIDLFAGLSNTSTAMTQTILDSDAETALIDGEGPYTGSFRPTESLEQLVGRNPLGLWTLEITDSTAANQGTLNDWGLILHAEPTDPSDLGVIVNTNLEGIDPSSEDLWYSMGVHRDGYLTVEVTLGEEVALQLVDATETVVASGTGRLDFANALVGSTYRLRVRSDSTDVDLRLSNMIRVNGTEVTVFSTELADQFSFDASVSRQFSINEVDYDFDAEELTYLSFYGGGGDDLVTLHGSSEDETTRLWPNSGLLFGQDYTVDVWSVRQIDVDGGGGNDVAMMYDSSENDLYVARPLSATMRDVDRSLYSNSVDDFDQIDAYVINPDGYDKAHLWDSPTNDDFFATPDSARMEGEGFLNTAESFDRYYGHTYADSGVDRAQLFGSDRVDTMIAKPDEVRHFSKGLFFNIVMDFENVHGYSKGGGVDQAIFEGTVDGDNFQGTPTEAKLTMPDSFVRAKFFEKVEVHGNGGDDRAELLDSTGNDWLVASPTDTTFSGGGFSHHLIDYPAVYAYAREGGRDMAKLYDSDGDDTFVGTSEYGKLRGSGFILRAKFFDQVHAYAKEGGNDVARFTGTDGNDSLIADAPSVKLFGEDYLLRAKFFEQNEVRAGQGEGDYDRAELFDDQGIDHLTADGSGNGQLAQLTYANGQNVDVWYFDFVLAESTHDTGNTKSIDRSELNYRLNDLYWQ